MKYSEIVNIRILDDSKRFREKLFNAIYAIIYNLEALPDKDIIYLAKTNSYLYLTLDEKYSYVNYSDSNLNCLRSENGDYSYDLKKLKKCHDRYYSLFLLVSWIDGKYSLLIEKIKIYLSSQKVGLTFRGDLVDLKLDKLCEDIRVFYNAEAKDGEILISLDNFENEKTYFSELDTNSLNLTTRTFNSLRKKWLSIDEIKSMSTDELRNIRGIGPKAISEILTKLEKNS